MGFLVRVAQANNQWNIGAELGSDPMESAFARTLTAGIKGVAMVLDQEVQPLTSDSTKCWACQEVQGFSCHVLVIITLLFCSFALLHRLFICPKRWGLPCSGVWCLFEFLLSSRENLELVFVTNAGVIGDAAWRKQVCLKVCVDPGNHCCFYDTASFSAQCACCGEDAASCFSPSL